jgi:hypothetical protein
MKSTHARVTDLWCRLMHKESMWPSHGQYQCRTCGRLQTVCWEQASPAESRALLPPVETRARGAFVTGVESSIQCS